MAGKSKNTGDAEKATHVNKPAQEPKDMQGGGVVETVTVEVPEGTPAHDGIEVITTAPGTLSAAGIIPVGTKMQIEGAKYSARWMAPATAKAAKMIDAMNKKG